MWVRYLDGTEEPYWTERFARCGKVSRTGRVQPCLGRVVLTAGPGLPIRMWTAAGGQSLRKYLRQQLERDTEEAEEGGFWLTIIDAEAAVARLLKDLTEVPNHAFVTVLKGAILKGAQIVEAGPWQPYRERDRVREVLVVVRGAGVPEEGLALRGVEMERAQSRNPHRTLFATDAAARFLSTQGVPDAYLSRWPNEEAVIRRARRGAGLERSHGYTGQYVTHVALREKLASAERRVERTGKLLEAARTREEQVRSVAQEFSQPESRPLAAEMVKQAARSVREAEKRHTAAVQEAAHQSSMPREIFERDTTRENVATVMTMGVLLLVEWVLREYLGGARMELRAFLNYFLYLPVEVRTTWHRVLYRIDARTLSADRVALLRKACEEITRRRIRRSGRWLKFEVAGPLGQDEGEPRN
jgi:hypothetical protein